MFGFLPLGHRGIQKSNLQACLLHDPKKPVIFHNALKAPQKLEDPHTGERFLESIGSTSIIFDCSHHPSLSPEITTSMPNTIFLPQVPVASTFESMFDRHETQVPWPSTSSYDQMVSSA